MGPVTAAGDSDRYGLSIRYSQEPPGALETGGGILAALPMLGDDPFLLVSGDCWTDLDFPRPSLPAGDLAPLVLVDNPDPNPSGDFALGSDRLRNAGTRHDGAWFDVGTVERLQVLEQHLAKQP